MCVCVYVEANRAAVCNDAGGKQRAFTRNSVHWSAECRIACYAVQSHALNALQIDVGASGSVTFSFPSLGSNKINTLRFPRAGLPSHLLTGITKAIATSHLSREMVIVGFVTRVFR